MRSFRCVIASGMLCLPVSAGSAFAEATTQVKGVHLCCGACVTAVGKALGKIDGLEASCDKEKRTVTLTGTDKKVLGKGLTALRKAGFGGTTGDGKKKSKNSLSEQMKRSQEFKGKVASVTLSGAHNCCGACCKAIKEVVAEVEGVEGEDVKPKGKTFTVTGSFEAHAVVAALEKAGFAVRVDGTTRGAFKDQRDATEDLKKSQQSK